MEKYIRVKGSHEQQRGGARVLHVHHAGRAGPAKVVAHDAKTLAWRRVPAAGVERDDERRLGATVHIDREVGPDGGLNDGDEMLCEVAKHLAGVGTRVYGGQLGDDLGQLDTCALHGHGEKLLLGTAAAEDGSGGDAQAPGDLGQSGSLEAALHEDCACGLDHLRAADQWRTSH